jgi:hypothetical protein
MARLTRKDLEALYETFDNFVLEDQRSYYRSAISKSRTSASQVNAYRALFALMTGLASAFAGLIVAFYFTPGGECVVNSGTLGCNALSVVVFISIIIGVVAPVIGGAFGTLADLYQWDRLTTVYDAALENIEVADARFHASLIAYMEGTLSVMRDEAAQWGQLIRTPAAIEKFLEDAQQRVNEAQASAGNAAPYSPSSPLVPPTMSQPNSQPTPQPAPQPVYQPPQPAPQPAPQPVYQPPQPAPQPPVQESVQPPVQEPVQEAAPPPAQEFIPPISQDPDAPQPGVDQINHPPSESTDYGSPSSTMPDDSPIMPPGDSTAAG